MFRKLLCKIFLPPSEEKKDVAIQNGQVKQMEEEFLCPLPCVTVDRIGICHSISLIYIAHVAVIIRHNLRLYCLPVIIAEIALCWWVMDVRQNKYVAFVPLKYGCQFTPSPYLKVAPCHSLGA